MISRATSGSAIHFEGNVTTSLRLYTSFHFTNLTNLKFVNGFCKLVYDVPIWIFVATCNKHFEGSGSILE